MKKRILSLLLAVIMLLGCVNIGVYASNSSEEYAEEATMHMKNLGVFDANTDADRGVTRGEFAFAIYKIYGKGVDLGYRYSFADVGVSDSFYNAVSYCVSCGYMLGGGELFRPNDTITAMEAMTVVARLLNYTEYAKNNGDYSLGYYTTAKNIGILRNTGITETASEVTFGMASVMFYNALRSRMNMLAAVSESFNTYKVSDKIFAYEAMELNFTSGVMTSNGYADISGNEIYGKSTIVIDNQKFSTKKLNGDYKFYVGREVSVFYDDDSNIVSIAPTSKSNVVNIKREDFDRKSGNTIMYYMDDKTEKLQISSGAVYMKNGEVVVDFRSTGFEAAEFADLTLFDGDGDEVYEAVVVNVYKTFAVGSLGNDGRFSSVDNLQSVDLGDDNQKTVFVYNSAGEEKTFRDIEKDDILSIIEGKDFIYAIYSESMISGKITEIEDYSVSIDDMSFPITSAGNAKFSGSSVGDSVTVYFDFAGRVAKVIKGGTKVTPTSTYGFLINALFENKMQKKMEAKLLTNLGEINTYEFASRVRVDDKTYKIKSLSSLPAEFYESGKLRNTLVIYNLTNDGLISSIEFPKTSLSYDEDGFIKSYSKVTANMISNGTLTRGTPDANKFYFSGYEFLNASTAVFVVPDEEDMSLSDDDAFSIIQKSNIPLSTNIVWDTYHFSKYNGFADAVVIYGSFAKKAFDTPLSVVVSIGETLDSKGNEVYQIKHFYNNAVVVSTAKKDTKITELQYDEYNQKKPVTIPISSLKTGDGVRIALDAQGAVRDAERVFEYNASSNPFKDSSISGAYATYSVYLNSGYVAYNDGTLLRIAEDRDSALALDGDIYKKIGLIFSSAKIAVVEDGKGGAEVRSGNTADISIGDLVVYQARTGVGTYLIVYKDK